jgi:hypothetical protein
MRMKLLSRLGFVSGALAGGVVVGIVWLGASGVFNTSSAAHLSAGYSDVASIHLQPVPEGPTSPMFVPEPRSVGDRPLALVRDLVPEPLPKPLDQPRSCDHGGDLIIILKDGREITYGPCDYPWQISQLWGAMIEVWDTTEPGARADNPSALAATEQVRQALRAALQRNPIGKGQFAATEIACAPVGGGRDAPSPGYLCAATLRSESGVAGVKHVSFCALLVAGHVSYSPAPATGPCELRLPLQ